MLFKNIDELKQYIPSNMQVNIATVQSFIQRAETKYIIPKVLGKELFTILDEYYNDESSSKEDDATLDDLLPYVQRPLAYFAYWLSVNINDVAATATGFGVVQNQNVAPASKDRVAAFKTSVEEAAWDGVEQALIFLEENQEDYQDWITSSAYTETYTHLIQNATTFNQFIDIEESRLLFKKMTTIMANEEVFSIQSVISKEYFDELLADILSSSISEPNALILSMLQPALANLTYSKYEESEKGVTPETIYHKDMGTAYLNKALDYMIKHIADFPTYAESDLYTAPEDDETPTIPNYENTKCAKTFTFGG